MLRKGRLAVALALFFVFSDARVVLIILRRAVFMNVSWAFLVCVCVCVCVMGWDGMNAICNNKS